MSHAAEGVELVERSSSCSGVVDSLHAFRNFGSDEGGFSDVQSFLSAALLKVVRPLKCLAEVLEAGAQSAGRKSAATQKGPVRLSAGRRGARSLVLESRDFDFLP